jgi:hypothetical protein
LRCSATHLGVLRNPPRVLHQAPRSAPPGALECSTRRLGVLHQAPWSAPPGASECSTRRLGVLHQAPWSAPPGASECSSRRLGVLFLTLRGAPPGAAGYSSTHLAVLFHTRLGTPLRTSRCSSTHRLPRKPYKRGVCQRFGELPYTRRHLLVEGLLGHWHFHRVAADFADSVGPDHRSSAGFGRRGGEEDR